MAGGVRGVRAYCTVDELMAVALARTIEDHAVVFNGVAVALPYLAILLAQKTHAPNCVFLAGLPAGVDPHPPFLPPTAGDALLLQAAVVTLPLHEIFDLAQRGELDRSFLGGGQIDRHGNLNNAWIGCDGMRVRLPGGAGAGSLSCFARKFTVWSGRHRGNGRSTLVERVDFITTVGHDTPAGSRSALHLKGGGPDRVVTDLCTFDFSGGEMRLKTLHPGISLTCVLGNMGFQPRIPGSLVQTPPPTAEEIQIIRRLDPLKVRQREFSPRQLERKFPVA